MSAVENQTTGLNQLKILDISSGISGSYTTRLFAGWGAAVIKIEPPAGDAARFAGSEAPSGRETSPLFLYLNTGKQSITLNWETETGIALLREMLKTTDVLVENFTPGYLESIGLGYAVLEKINPRLIMTSITWFGQHGPYAFYRGGGMAAYAMGGQMWVCGLPEREPLNAGFAVAEYTGGLYGFIGSMLALQHRVRTGEGQQADVSIFECLAGSHQFTLTWPAYSGVLLERPGWPGSRAPLSFFQCADGFVNLRLQGIEMGFLATLFDMPALADDPRFSNYAARNANIRELEDIVIKHIAGLKKQTVFQTAGEWRQLCGYVASPADLLVDPQYLSREFWVGVGHPLAGDLLYPGAPVKMSSTPWTAARAPLLGEHNFPVYHGHLGYTRDDIIRLREAGVI